MVPTTDEPDETLVSRTRRGDTRAFELLMRRHNPRAFRIARAMLGDHEAEDAMQEAYLSVFTHIASFDGRSRFSSWLSKIVIHEALARRRKRDRMSLADECDAFEAIPAPTRDPEGVASDGELRALIDEAVDALPVPFRAVFVMRALEELSVAETAAVLDLPEETVRTRLFRAHRALRNHLGTKVSDVREMAYSFHLGRCDRVVAGVLRRIGVTSGK